MCPMHRCSSSCARCCDLTCAHTLVAVEKLLRMRKTEAGAQVRHLLEKIHNGGRSDFWQVLQDEGGHQLRLGTFPHVPPNHISSPHSSVACIFICLSRHKCLLHSCDLWRSATLQHFERLHFERFHWPADITFSHVTAVQQRYVATPVPCC
jgi:hypothetical protein